MARRRLAADEGVSAVVSAVLLFSLFSTAFLLWSLETLPQWVEDREHNHAAQTAAGFSRIAAELDATPVGEPATLTLGLSPPRIPLLQPSAAAGTLSVEPGFRFQATFSGERAFMIGGAMVATPNDLPSASGVATIRALEVAYDSPGNTQTGYTQVTAYDDLDGDGALDANEPSVVARLGKRTGNLATICGNAEAYLEIRTGSGPAPPVVATHALACSPSNSASFSLNLMASEYRFASLLGRLGDDSSFTSSGSGAGGFRVAMVWTGTDGATRTAGLGLPTSTDLDLEGDRVAFQGLYQEFSQRTVAFEGGGVVNIEDLGSAFAQSPHFRAIHDNGEGHLHWRIVDLSGEGSVAGSGTGTLRFTKAAVNEYVLRLDGGQADFTISTDAPTAWQQLWTDARVLAGFDVGDMAVSGSADTATLQLANIPWTLHLSIIHADVSVT